jgi:hypothetical protein
MNDDFLDNLEALQFAVLSRTHLRIVQQFYHLSEKALSYIYGTTQRIQRTRASLERKQSLISSTLEKKIFCSPGNLKMALFCFCARTVLIRGLDAGKALLGRCKCLVSTLVS